MELSYRFKQLLRKWRTILNLRLWWRIWRNPLVVPDPEEISDGELTPADRIPRRLILSEGESEESIVQVSEHHLRQPASRSKSPALAMKTDAR